MIGSCFVAHDGRFFDSEISTTKHICEKKTPVPGVGMCVGLNGEMGVSGTRGVR